MSRLRELLHPILDLLLVVLVLLFVEGRLRPTNPQDIALWISLQKGLHIALLPTLFWLMLSSWSPPAQLLAEKQPSPAQRTLGLALIALILGSFLLPVVLSRALQPRASTLRLLLEAAAPYLATGSMISILSFRERHKTPGSHEEERPWTLSLVRVLLWGYLFLLTWSLLLAHSGQSTWNTWPVMSLVLFASYFPTRLFLWHTGAQHRTEQTTALMASVHLFLQLLRLSFSG